MSVRGVVTTGIYCRANCSARPAKKNVRPLQNAIAAQAAGFRPCLICRPDRMPNVDIPQPASEIAHAVRLIAEGFLDTATTDDLAARIGYSTRHLTRLFDERVGASPDFVARSRRAHLARRLLDESDLSVTHIAYASGFSNARQMNRVMRSLFGFSPSELRRKRRKRDRLPPLDGGLRLRLPYSGPYDGQQLITYLGTRAISGVETVVDGMYRRATITCGCPSVIDVRDPGDDAHLEVTMHLATFGSIIDEVERVRTLFGLQQDTTEAEQFLSSDPLLAPLVRRQPGLRLGGAWDRFETSVRIIVGQQVSVAGASTVTGRIASRYGTPLDDKLPDGLEHTFPTADVLADADLRDIGMPSARAQTIIAFSRAVASEQLDLSRVAPLEETCEQLQAIAGVGPWTANLIAARAMGHQDAFAASDLGLRRRVSQLLGQKELPSTREMMEIAESWRPYRTTAMAYLWMSGPTHADEPRTRSRRTQDA